MKRFFTLIIVIVLIVPAFAFADLPDLSCLSFDELVQLKEQINLAIWNSQEWQEVVVPIGVWKIGEDIPVGKWTISVPDDSTSEWGSVTYCDQLDYSGLAASYDGYINRHTALKRSDVNDDEMPFSVDIDCRKNTYLIISYTPMIFRPYTGKPDLGFK